MQTTTEEVVVNKEDTIVEDTNTNLYFNTLIFGSAAAVTLAIYFVGLTPLTFGAIFFAPALAGTFAAMLKL